MTGIAIPTDRTNKQPVRAYCRNPQCRDRSDKIFEFNVENDRFACPKCGANRDPMVGLYVLTHLLMQKKGGPIQGRYFQYIVACDEKRAYLATQTNLEAVTDNPTIANCPGCLKKIEEQKITETIGYKVGARTT